MIKVNENDVRMSGSIDGLMAELTIAIRSIYEALLELSDEEQAKECIALCGRLALESAKSERRQ